MRNMMRPDGDYNFAEWIMQRIDAEWQVSKALGHSSIQTTERYYGKWNKAQQDIMDEEIVKALIGAVQN